MAQYTKHPVAALPTAPERESTGHLLLRGYVIAVLFVAFAHSAVYNLLGEIGAAIVLALFSAATLAIGVPMLARNRPQPFRWRRLPGRPSATPRSPSSPSPGPSGGFPPSPRACSWPPSR